MLGQGSRAARRWRWLGACAAAAAVAGCGSGSTISPPAASGTPPGGTTTGSTTTGSVTTGGTTTGSVTTGGTTSPPVTAAVSFSRDVLPIFTNNGARTCAQPGCHSGADAQQGQDLEAGSAYTNIVDVSSTEKPGLLRVKPGDSANSYLFQKITGASGIIGAQMPFTGGPLSAAQIATIKGWIDEGAPQN